MSHGAHGWIRADLRLANNAPVSAHTQAVVNAWLASTKRNFTDESIAEREERWLRDGWIEEPGYRWRDLEELERVGEVGD